MRASLSIPAAGDKAPTMRERDVALSVGQLRSQRPRESLTTSDTSGQPPGRGGARRESRQDSGSTDDTLRREGPGASSHGQPTGKRWKQLDFMTLGPFRRESWNFGDDVEKPKSKPGRASRRYDQEFILAQMGKRYGPKEKKPFPIERDLPVDTVRVARNKRVTRFEERAPVMCGVPRQGGRGKGGKGKKNRSGADGDGLSGDDGDSYDDLDDASDVDEDYRDASSPVGQAGRATRRSRLEAYWQMRGKASTVLYKDVFARVQRCEESEVPPAFEPALRPEESRMTAEALTSREALHKLQEDVLRYRLAAQNTKVPTVEDLQASQEEAEAYVPMVRAIRYVHEEQNWANALATLARNAERLAAEKAAKADAAKSATARGEHGAGGAPLTPRRALARAAGMGSYAINSATTPGWMRHREFTQEEWDELHGKGRGSKTARTPSTPRNPTVPAWMHRLNQAQAEQEASDAQVQKLNAIQSMPATRIGRRGEARYTVAQSHRIGRVTDAAAEDAVGRGGAGEDPPPAAFAVLGPTRVDVSAAHPGVVDNELDGCAPVQVHPAGSTSATDGVGSEASLPSGWWVEGESEGEGGDDAQERGLERVTFPLYEFSTFEMVQEMKRITWWCAAHGIDRFTLRAGQREAAASDNGHRQSRSFSPAFFPDACRFSDEALVTARRDVWLSSRVTVVGHRDVKGEIDIMILPETLREAEKENWIQRKDGEKKSPSKKGASMTPRDAGSQKFSFFTNTPHPSGAEMKKA